MATAIPSRRFYALLTIVNCCNTHALHTDSPQLRAVWGLRARFAPTHTRIICLVCFALINQFTTKQTAQYPAAALARMAAAGADLAERRKQRIPDLMLDMLDAPTNLRSTQLADTKIIHANESNYKKDMVGAPTRGRAAEERQAKVAGEYVKAMQAMDRKYVGTPKGTVGPTEAALADHSHGGVVGRSRLRRLRRVQPVG